MKTMKDSKTGSAASGNDLGDRPLRARRVVGIKRTLTIWLLAMGLVFAGGFAIAPPASAATGYTSARICFQHVEGGPYTYEFKTQVYSSDGRWYNVIQTLGTRNGCHTVALLPGYYWRFIVSKRVGNALFTGYSQYVYAQPNRAYNFGTVWVRQDRW
ncbi:hypothetical protein [Paeniglutamicibacter cryotolerans]|uniref:Uncharacterized protein n=1 Tax=Paeniglutamicibacter cryotolerans TaxID=670079 RepID=A0A839QNC6_9MICC|nr:hypothetical protein [Paeniglutamicibacter cryotolerans]MBB2997103.1 hypothetical protein [Paeniglutamicibacter cryotolerans]